MNEVNSEPLIYDKDYKEEFMIRIPQKKIYQVRYASIQILENPENNNEKKIVFTYPEEEYLVYITMIENPLFGHDNNTINKTQGNRTPRTNRILPHLDIIAERYLIELNIKLNEQDEPIKIKLDREHTSISQGTLHYMNEKERKLPNLINMDQFKLFKYELEAYNIIEIETKNVDKISNALYEDILQNAVYLLIEKEEIFIELLSKLIFSMLFSKESLENYINKYILEMIIHFTHLPHQSLLKFLKGLGVDELKNEVDEIQSIAYKNKIKAPLVANQKNNEYHVYIKASNIFDRIYNEKNFEINVVSKEDKTKLTDKSAVFESEKEKEMYSSQTLSKYNEFLSNCIIVSINQMKIDPFRTLTKLFDLFNTHIQSKINDIEKINTFLICHLTKKLIGYTTFNGFFNIDTIISDEDMECCCEFGNEETQKKCNSWFNKIMSSGVSAINYVLKMNEGYSHKHITVNGKSFSFNDKNIIHIFSCGIDASSQNKLRFFDIPFHDSWLMKISSLIMLIYRNVFGLLQINNDLSDYETLKERCDSLLLNSKPEVIQGLFKETVASIAADFFEKYSSVLPNYFGFCENIVNVPLKGYRCVDNVCQHFANTSGNILIKKSCMYFVPYDNNDYDDIRRKYHKPIPNFDCILEPYLIMADKSIYEYLKSPSKDAYFSKHMTADELKSKLKKINYDKAYLNLNPIDYANIQQYQLKVFDYDKLLKEDHNDMSYDYLFLLNYVFNIEFKDNNRIFQVLKELLIIIAEIKEIQLKLKEIKEKELQEIEIKKKELREIEQNERENEIKEIMKQKDKNIHQGMNLTTLYYDYMKFVTKTEIMNKTEKDYMKIGYYLIHLHSYSKEEDYFNSNWYQTKYTNLLQ